MISDFITHIHMLCAQNLQDVGSLDDNRNLYVYMRTCTHTHALSSPPPPTPSLCKKLCEYTVTYSSFIT